MAGDEAKSSRETKAIALDLRNRSGSATLRLAADRKRLQIVSARRSHLAVDRIG